MSWLQRDEKVVWHPFTQHQTAAKPLPIVRGEGTLLFDENGKSYIDANSSWWVNTHGHGHPHIGKALSDQFNAIDHVIFAGVTHPKAVELSERLIDLLPKHFQKVFFSDNGSTATEVALKMCFQYFFDRKATRGRFMAMHGAYHGDTFGAMSVGERDRFNRPFEPYFFDVDYIDFPDGTNDELVLNQAEELLKTEEFAGLIVEPLVQGASGMRMYSVEFLDRLSALAKKYGTFVVFDEVMTGFGRTGTMFAMDQCEVKPDIITMSKGLTAGVLPMGLTIATQEMFDSFLSDDTAKGFLHGHSFTGNPLACAVGCANLDLFEQEETKQALKNIGEWNHAFLSDLAQHEMVENERQMGTILAFDVINEKGTTYFSNLRNIAYDYFVEHGVLIRPLGNVIFINPPYCITHDEYQTVKKTIFNFLDQLKKG